MKNFQLIILAAFLSALQALLLKNYVESNNWKYIYYCIISDLILFIFYITLFMDYHPGHIYVIVKVLSIVVVTIFSLYFIKGSLKSNHVLGILLCIVAIAIIYEHPNSGITGTEESHYQASKINISDI